MLPVTPGITIPGSELGLTFSRSGGPGGQHVNKVETQVTVSFDIGASAVLSDAQKARIGERLAGRINRDGVLTVTSNRHRSQSANREDALVRMAALIRGALKTPPKRKRTRPTRASKLRRLESKRRRGELKRLRGKIRE